MDSKKQYDWAKAMLAIAESQSSDLNEIAAAAELDPKGGDLTDVDFSEVDLSGQNLTGWDLRGANLTGAQLEGTELRHALLDPWELIQGSNWEKANLDHDMREQASNLNPALPRNCDELAISVRSAKCIRDFGCRMIGDLVQKTEADLLQTPYFGRKSVNEIKEALVQMGLHLGMELPGWPPMRFRRTAGGEQ